MNTHKSRQAAVTVKTPGQVESDLRSNVTVHHSDLNEVEELTIDEDFDLGADPYNSTGRHAIIKPKTGADE